MAPLSIEDLKQHISLIDVKNFVETGTYYGNTIFAMEKYFENLYTIEVKKELYNNCVSKYNGNKINFYLGDSGLMLYKIIKILDNKTIFWLDGHYGGGTLHGKGLKTCPLVEEITQIMNYLIPEAYIIIDDYRLFNTNLMPVSKEQLTKIVKPRLLNTFHFPSCHSNDDRLVFHIDKKI